MKFGPLVKGIKMIDIIQDEIFSEEQPGTPFLTTERMGKFWRS